MASQQENIWVFRIFNFLAKWGHQLGEEWFKLMEWLLIISALSFAGGLSNNTWVKALPYISIIILWVYIFFGYSGLYFDRLERSKLEITSLKVLLKYFVLASIVCIFLLQVARLFFSLANEVAVNLAIKIREKENL